MSKKIKHTPAAIFDMLEELQLSLEILEEKMDNIYDIVKSKPQKDYGYSNDDEYDDDDEDEDEDDDRMIIVLVGMIGMMNQRENKL